MDYWQGNNLYPHHYIDHCQCQYTGRKFFFKVTLTMTNWLMMIFYTAVIGIAPAITSILINQTGVFAK